MNNSLGIRQKGESQKGGNKKSKYTIFSEKRTFLIPDTQGVRNIHFSENLACFSLRFACSFVFFFHLKDQTNTNCCLILTWTFSTKKTNAFATEKA